MRCILDIECNGLNPTKIFVVVLKDIDNDKLHVFKNKEDLKFFLDCNSMQLIVGHNLIAFDLHWLATLWDCRIPREVVRDTLVLSRLLDQRLEGGHSLEEWGTRLGFPKLQFKNFDEYSDEMLEYCINDVNLNHLLYLHLEKQFRFPRWEDSIKLEHDMAFLCRDMQTRGFAFDHPTAAKLLDEVKGLILDLDKQLEPAFPPQKKLVRTFEPKRKKDGEWNAKTTELFMDPMVELTDGLLHKYAWEEFNPRSPKQVIDRIKDHWEPVDKTEGHKEAVKARDKERLAHFKTYGWKINEVNLATLKDTAPPEFKLLVKRIMLGARQSILESWISFYNPDTKAIHGTFNSLGTWTHRLSHTDPNLGNVSAEKTIKYKGEELRKIAIHYGGMFRGLFQARPGYKLVGTDMEGAHLRLFAHFINDSSLIQALVSGDKKFGTDPHTLNKNKLGDVCPDRDLAKTFIFTYLNGGGVGKVMEIFQCSRERAEAALNQFIEGYPGLAILKRDIVPSDAKRGYFYGFDGRKVLCDSEHLMVAGYLQCGEAVVVKRAVIKSLEHFKKIKIPAEVVNIVHDEMQFEVPDDQDIIKYVGDYSSKMITQAGIDFGIVCPLAGEWKQGYNWLESH